MLHNVKIIIISKPELKCSPYMGHWQRVLSRIIIQDEVTII